MRIPFDTVFFEKDSMDLNVCYSQWEKKGGTPSRNPQGILKKTIGTFLCISLIDCSIPNWQQSQEKFERTIQMEQMKRYDGQLHLL